MDSQSEGIGKTEFLGKLAYLLRDLPYDETADAISYYASYLSDVGPENEKRVIAELGGAEKIAEDIRMNLGVAPKADPRVPGQDPTKVELPHNQERLNPDSEVKQDNFAKEEKPESNVSQKFRENYARKTEQKNVNPYSQKSFYETHNMPKPERKQTETEEYNEAKQHTAIGVGIAAAIIIGLIIIGFVLLFLIKALGIPLIAAALIAVIIIFIKGKK